MVGKDYPRYWSKAFFNEFPKCDMLGKNYYEEFNNAFFGSPRQAYHHTLKND